MGLIDSKLTLNNNEDMNYISFGSGSKALVIIPGLSDGLSTIQGKGRLLSWYYRKFSKEFRVYVFSRKNQMSVGYSTKDMARDLAEAMSILDISKASIYGVSQGGMIAQHLAIDYPDKVEKLVLAITVSRSNETLIEVINSWIEYAKNNDYRTLMVDTMKKTFTRKKMKSYRLMLPFIGRFGKPKSFERFLIQANACIKHNTYKELKLIACPTLIIGGGNDRVVGENSSEEMAPQIPSSIMKIYPGQGHGAYDEVKTFNDEVKTFLIK